MVSSVSFSQRTGEWIVLGSTRNATGDNGELLLFEDELSEIKCVDIKRALQSSAEYWGPGAEPEAQVSALHRGSRHPEELLKPVDFALVGGDLLLKISFTQKSTEHSTSRQRVLRLLEPSLNAIGATARLDWWGPSDYLPPDEEAVALSVSPRWRGKTAADLVSLGERLLTLVGALGVDGLTPATARDVIRGGAAELLIGQPESQWLDAKADEYPLDSDRGKISLAQAVARFANANGGLIVFGASTNRVKGGGEAISGVRGVRSPSSRSRYIKILDRYLYPFPDGLTVELTPVEAGRQLVLIDVPEQAESLVPFLVNGATMADGRVDGSFISIVRRVGDESVVWSPQAIHSWLVAGRAVMRDEQPSP